MSYDIQEAALSGGTMLLQFKIEHDQFWKKLHKENSYPVFERIKLMLTILVSGILGFIHGKLFTFIFGGITPLTFPYGVIKCIILGTSLYAVGFEFGLRYNNYIHTIVHYSTKTPEAFIATELKNIFSTLDNITRAATDDVSRPLKKRCNSESNLKAKTDEPIKEKNKEV
jgi:hypothetical protein